MDCIVSTKTMENDFFTYLPSEVIIDILSRLPIRTILNCKCVCKSWFDLINTHEFINSHHSRSVPRLAAFCIHHTRFRFEDGYDLPFSSRCYRVHVGGSVNGFLFIRNFPRKRACVLNPITRDCITFDEDFSNKVTYCGFGTSKVTGKYKVVKIFHDRNTSYCRVYTLGTGLWRSIEPDAWVYYSYNNDGAFLNGNLHWLVRDADGAHWISCFDLENELFTTFSSPPLLSRLARAAYRRIVALEGSLYLCDNVYDYDEIVIWSMKEYGDENSWTKEFNFRRGCHGLWYGDFYPIRVSKDGDTVMFWYEFSFFSYSKMNNRNAKLQFYGWKEASNSILYTPNFLSLTSFANECVTSLFPSQMLPP